MPPIDELDHSQWSGKTDGLPWMQRALVALFKVMPLSLGYAVMAWVVPFYMIFNHQGYISTYRFFRLRFHFSPLKAFAYVYVNHFRFGQVILDRFAAWAGKKFLFDFENRNLFDDMESAPAGFVLLSSHVGNYEMAGCSFAPQHKRFNALVFAGETETVMRNRQRILSSHNIEMIPVASDLSHIFKMNAALDNGEILSLPADRLFGSAKTVTCRFFDAEAPFPVGAFMLAASKSAPALAFFVMKKSVRRYRVILRRIECDASLGLRQQVQQSAQSFASQLEEVVRRYPAQWFNYYDFFSKTPKL